VLPFRPMTRPLALGTLLVALHLASCRDPAPSAETSAPPAPQPATAEAVPAVAPERASDVRAAPLAAAPQPLPGALVPPVPPAPVPGGAVPVAPAAGRIREAIAVDPQGPIPLSLEEETVVDPATVFRVELAAEISDGRILLLDAADAIVPASGTREVGATTRFTLKPAAPLVPGSRYVLRLDGARTRELKDMAGTALAPVSLRVLVAGEPPKPEPKPAPKPAPKRKRVRR
jgi:hypothetical protein